MKLVLYLIICLELRKEMTSQALEYEGKIEQLEESLEGLGKSSVKLNKHLVKALDPDQAFRQHTDPYPSFFVTKKKMLSDFCGFFTCTLFYFLC